MSQVEGGRAQLWLRTKEIVADAIALPLNERYAFVNAQCGADEALRHEVVQTLKYATGNTGFIEEAAVMPDVDAMAAATPKVEVSLLGQRVGAYQIDGELGRGGMGVVYSARRADGAYQQRVAIKLLHSASIGAAEARRFARERQLLAQLDHPNIARLLDGGTTEAGMPYLVMEVIDGVQIDTFANTKKLAAPARVTLVRGVCAAVQSAHQKLLIHRDIKPANILVTSLGQPKLLDFGIARLLEEAGNTAVGSATLDSNMLTPRYASPEQVRGEAVSVATDVYALGLLLYELLGGASPYERIASAKVTSAAAALQVVLEDAPRKLSDVAKISAPENAEKLIGDLDTIALKACAKLPAERYATVAALDEDLRRYLAEEPILARPPALFYSFKKLIVRNRIASAATAFAVVAMVAGGASTLIQKRKTEERYAQVRQLANSLIFKYYDEIEPLAGSTPVRKMIAADGVQFLDSLSVDAAGDDALVVEIATGYNRMATLMFNGRNMPHLGEKASAETMRGKAQAMLETVLRKSPNMPAANKEMAFLDLNIGALLAQNGDTAKGLVQIESAAKRYDKVWADNPADERAGYFLLQTYLDAAQAAVLGGVDANGYMDKAEAAFKQWSAGRKPDLETPNMEMSIVRKRFQLAFAAKDYPKALEYADKEIIGIKKMLSGNNALEDYATLIAHVRTAYAFKGVILTLQDKPQQALEPLAEAEKIGVELMAKDKNNITGAITLARIYVHTGKAKALLNANAEALQLFDKAIAMYAALDGKSLPAFAYTHRADVLWRAMVASKALRDNKAETRYARALTAYAKSNATVFATAPASAWLAEAQRVVGG